MDASVLTEVSELPRWISVEEHENPQPLGTRVYLNEKLQCHDMVLGRMRVASRNCIELGGLLISLFSSVKMKFKKTINVPWALTHQRLRTPILMNSFSIPRIGFPYYSLLMVHWLLHDLGI